MQPYWDLAIDAADDKTAEGSNGWFFGPLFSDKWFPYPSENAPNGTGRGDGETDNMNVPGRFADVPVPTNYSAPTHNAFGRMTEAYNPNQSPRLTRSRYICGFPSYELKSPGCEEVKGVLAQTNLREFHEYMENVLHVKMHMMYGGMWDCLYGENDQKTLHLGEVFAKHPNLAKTGMLVLLDVNAIVAVLRADGYLDCPSTCAGGTGNYASCRCHTDKFDALYESGQFESNYTAVYELLGTLGLLPVAFDKTSYNYINYGASLVSPSKSEWYFMNMTAEENELVMRLYLLLSTNPGQLSQMSSPLASSNDPMFWPIHAEFGRYLDYVRLEPLYENFNWTWDGEWLDVAHKSGIYGPGYTEHLPFTRFKGMAKPRNVAPDQPAKDDGLPGGKGEALYTNEELLRLSHPDNADLPYVWETFTWGPEDDACTVKDALTETGRQKARAMKAREQPFSVEVLRGRNGWW